MSKKPVGSGGLSSTLNYGKPRLTAPPQPDLSSPFCIRNVLISLIPGLLGRPALLPRDVRGGKTSLPPFNVYRRWRLKLTSSGGRQALGVSAGVQLCSAAAPPLSSSLPTDHELCSGSQAAANYKRTLNSVFTDP